MSKKFVRVKRLIIPMLTAALLLSTAAPALALSATDIATLEADGVAIEAIVPQAQAGNIVATAYTSTGLNIDDDEFWISAGYLLDYRGPGGDVVIPEGVTQIASGYAFRKAANKDKITSVTIPSTLPRVSQGTFLGCTSLKQVTILGDATKLYNSSFAIGKDDDGYKYNEDLTIRCGAGSTGEAYAKEMGFNVEIIDTSAYNQAEETTTPTTTETTPATTETTPTTTETTEPTQSATTVVDPDGYEYFPDVKNGAWYAEAVNAMAKTGIINGCDDGLFYPDATLTEGEWAALTTRLATFNGADLTGKKDLTGKHWAYAMVILARGWGYTRVNEGHEDEPVNRGEAITAIMTMIHDATEGAQPNAKFTEQYEARLAELQSQPGYKTWTLEDIPDHEVIEYNFRDTSLVTENQLELALKSKNWAFVPHSWEPESIVEAYNEGIIQGKDGGVCDPLGTLTRAEAAQILYNAGLTYRLNIISWWTSGWNIRPVE